MRGCRIVTHSSRGRGGTARPHRRRPATDTHRDDVAGRGEKLGVPGRALARVQRSSTWERLSKLVDWNLPQIDEHEEKRTKPADREGSKEKRPKRGTETRAGQLRGRLKLEELESVRDLGPSRVKVFVIWFRDSEKCVFTSFGGGDQGHGAALLRAGLARRRAISGTALSALPRSTSCASQG